jgi:hypothetical protein
VCLSAVIFASAWPPIAHARNNYLLFESEPLSCVVVDGEVWLAAGRHWAYNHGARCGIWKYDPTTDRETLYQDYNLPGSVYALAANETLVMAGGSGVSVYDRQRGTWRPVTSFDTLSVDDIAADDTVFWLATSGHGVVGVDFRQHFRLRPRVGKAQGLASDRVLSLFLLGDTMLVGTYRFGRTDKWPERSDDLYGLGLQAIDKKTLSVRDVRLPKDSLVQRQWLVTQMLPDSRGAVEVALWQPWCDYRWSYGKPRSPVTRVGPVWAGPVPTVEMALRSPGMPTDSVSVARIHSFLSRHIH